MHIQEKEYLARGFQFNLKRNMIRMVHPYSGLPTPIIEEASLSDVFSHFLNQVYQEDQEFVRECLDYSYLEQCMKKMDSISFSCRYQTNSNQMIWLEIHISQIDSAEASFPQVIYFRVLHNSKLKEYELINRIHNRTDRKTENLQSGKKYQKAMYVIEKHSRKVLYMNSRMTLLMPDMKQGAFCYQSLHYKNEICDYCPLVHLEQEEYTTDNIYIKSINRYVDIEFSNMIWVNGEEACLSVIEMNFSELQKENLKNYSLIDSLKQFFRCIIEINLVTEEYEMIHIWNDITKQTLNRKGLEEAIEYFLTNFVHPDDRNKFCTKQQILKRLNKGEKKIMVEYRHLMPSGQYRWMCATITYTEKENSKDTWALIFIEDVQEKAESLEQNLKLSEKVRYEKERRRIAEWYQLIARQSQAMVLEWIYPKRIIYVSEKFEEIFGKVEERGIQNLDFHALLSCAYEEDRYLLQAFLIQIENGETPCEIKCRIYNKNQEFRWYRFSVRIIRNSIGMVERGIVMIQDIHEDYINLIKLEYYKEYDSLTGIYNQNKFFKEVNRFLQEKAEKQYAMIIFDINKFKIVNDRLGIETGDRLLGYIGQLLREEILAPDIFGRLYSDTFGIFINYCTDEEIIQKIKRIEQKIEQNPLQIKIQAAFGIYRMKGKEKEASILCDRAKIAKNMNKGSMLTYYTFYHEKFRTDIIATAEMEHDITRALQNREFKMYLQPKYWLKTEKMIGAEALVRWAHPEKGLIMPDQFIPTLEQNGFIMWLDEYMLEEACRQLRKWADEGQSLIPISVNLSRYHIYNQDLVGKIKKILAKYAIDKKYLILEFTENLFVKDTKGLFGVLEMLKQDGLFIEMDDFGTGYSSLHMLLDMPIQCIKIDKAFLEGCEENKKGQSLIRHTIQMAKDLDLLVVVEGVETEEQLKFLKMTECDIVQGFLFSKPLEIQRFEQLKEREKM